MSKKYGSNPSDSAFNKMNTLREAFNTPVTPPATGGAMTDPKTFEDLKDMTYFDISNRFTADLDAYEPDSNFVIHYPENLNQAVATFTDAEIEQFIADGYTNWLLPEGQNYQRITLAKTFPDILVEAYGGGHVSVMSDHLAVREKIREFISENAANFPGIEDMNIFCELNIEIVTPSNEFPRNMVPYSQNIRIPFSKAKLQALEYYEDMVAVYESLPQTSILQMLECIYFVDNKYQVRSESYIGVRDDARGHSQYSDIIKKIGLFYGGTGTNGKTYTIRPSVKLIAHPNSYVTYQE